MVLSSPIPSFLRSFVWFIVFTVLFSISCFGQSVFLAVPSTPYDHQMARVFPVLTRTSGQLPGPVSLSLVVNHWMTQLRAMPYQYSKHWQTPAEVSFAQATDCKGKAVTLYVQMRKYGARNVRVVIGKRTVDNAITHAWLEWETAEGSYVLDPTFNEAPTRRSELDVATYIPLYAYDAEHKYRAASAGYVASTAKTAPAYGVYVPTASASSFTRSTSSGLKSGRSYSAAKKYATPSTPYRPPNAQNSSASIRYSYSPSNTEGFRQFRTTAAAPSTRYLPQLSSKPVTAQKPSTLQPRSQTMVRKASVRRHVSHRNLATDRDRDALATARYRDRVLRNF
jgi:hypothetical protein